MTQDALIRIADLLPANWGIDQVAGSQGGGRRRDEVIDLTSSNGDRASFVVETVRSGSVPTLLLLARLREAQRQMGVPALLISDYIGPSLRTALADERFSYADATGWIRIVSEDPLVLLTGQGASRSPRDRQGSAVSRLNGVAANRAIRALVAVDLPVGVRCLAAEAAVSPGSVSKLLVTLASEGIVDRDRNGRVLTVRRRALIRRWVRDYSFAKSNTLTSYYIAPRGLDRTLDRLDVRGGVTVTGSAAARRILPLSVTSVVPLRLLALYAADPAGLARELGLLTADAATANVVIAAPQDTGILPASQDQGALVAPVPLVLADLLTLPGRAEAEADQLLAALATVDPNWGE